MLKIFNIEELEKSRNKKNKGLRKELENILLQVYLEHINKTKDFDIKVFENHVI